MCEAMDVIAKRIENKGIRKGIQQGKLETVLSLFRDGTIKAEKAADKKPAKKTAPKKEEAQVYFEFGGKQFDPAVVAENVKKAYVSAGHKASSIKSLKVYIKAEDNAAYFVINNKETGKIVL